VAATAWPLLDLEVTFQESGFNAATSASRLARRNAPMSDTMIAKLQALVEAGAKEFRLNDVALSGLMQEVVETSEVLAPAGEVVKTREPNAHGEEYMGDFMGVPIFYRKFSDVDVEASD
jgi:hypothetical protein